MRAGSIQPGTMAQIIERGHRFCGHLVAVQKPVDDVFVEFRKLGLGELNETAVKLIKFYGRDGWYMCQIENSGGLSGSPHPIHEDMLKPIETSLLAVKGAPWKL